MFPGNSAIGSFYEQRSAELIDVQEPVRPFPSLSGNEGIQPYGKDVPANHTDGIT